MNQRLGRGVRVFFEGKKDALSPKCDSNDANESVGWVLFVNASVGPKRWKHQGESWKHDGDGGFANETGGTKIVLA